MNSGSEHNSTSVKNRPAKRVLLIRNANAFDFGGAERFVVNLAKELTEDGWESTLVTAHQTLLAHAKAERVDTITGKWWDRQDWSGKKTLLAPVYFLWQIRLVLWYVRLFRRLKPTVVHPQGKDDFIAATVAAHLLGIRVVWTDHADLKYIFQNVQTPYKNPIGKLVRACSRWAAAITLVSQSEAKLVSESLGTPLPSRYQVIYNGIRDAMPPLVERKRADEKALVFCATSRLVTAKGIGELIKAFRRIATPQMRLWLLGEGPEEAVFRKQAGDDPRIVFRGFPENSLGILRSADIFVHPSYHEGFSISLIEAAMLGKPIIACNVGGNPEIIANQKNGLLVPARNVDALADAMQHLAVDKALRQRLSLAARQTYKANFQFDTIVKESFIPLYEGRQKTNQD